MKRWLASILALCLFIGLLPAASAAPGAEEEKGKKPPEISAKSAILLDGLTLEPLYEKNADERMGMASTTKIMTALVAIRAGGLERKVTIVKQDVMTEGSSMYLRVNEVRTIRELLYGLMLSSGNDAALALARAVSGSVPAFVAEMNALAAKIGMKNTLFDNPSGLDSKNHYSTARDMALLAAFAMKNDVFSSIVSTKYFTYDNKSIKNHNKLLWKYEDSEGVKTGFTKKTGRCLVGSALKDGRRMVVVTLNAGDDWNDQIKLFDYGFAGMSERTLCESGARVGELPLLSGEEERVGLVTAGNLVLNLTDAELAAVEKVVCAQPMEYAPVTEGEPAGYLAYRINGKTVGKAVLVYEKSVAVREKQPSLWERILSFFGLG